VQNCFRLRPDRSCQTFFISFLQGLIRLLCLKEINSRHLTLFRLFQIQNILHVLQESQIYFLMNVQNSLGKFWKMICWRLFSLLQCSEFP